MHKENKGSLLIAAIKSLIWSLWRVGPWQYRGAHRCRFSFSFSLDRSWMVWSCSFRGFWILSQVNVIQLRKIHFGKCLLFSGRLALSSIRVLIKIINGPLPTNINKQEFWYILWKNMLLEMIRILCYLITNLLRFFFFPCDSLDLKCLI